VTLTIARAAREVATRTGHPRRAWALLRRHWLAAVVLGLGLVLRILVMIAYPEGFWIEGDSAEYVGAAFSHIADPIRPSGYSLFLTPLVWFSSMSKILLLQHLMGLGVAALSYAFLLRRGVNRYIAAVAIAPMVLESRLLVLEHYVLSETFYITVLMGAVVLLLWRDRPAIWQVIAVGLLLALAAVTRSVALAIIPGFALYLAIRRLGWRQFVAFVLAAGLGLGAYMTWYHADHGKFAMSAMSGRFLWARTTSFVDCSKLTLTSAEQRLCPTEPLDNRPRPEVYLWTTTSVQMYPILQQDKLYGYVAREAILHQPFDYLAVIVKGTWALMPFGYPAGTGYCNYLQYELPTADPGPCFARYLAPVNPATEHYVGNITQLRGPLLAPLNWYSRYAMLPGGVSGLAFLFVVVAAFVRPRRSSLREWLDPLLLAGLAFGMIVASVAGAEADTRYEAPSLPFALIGAALAWQRLRQVTRTPEPNPSTVDDQEPASIASSFS
jgi:hypothetical protein